MTKTAMTDRSAGPSQYASNEWVRKAARDGFDAGRQSAYLNILSACLRQIAPGCEEARLGELVEERQEAVRALREVCAEFGDNDWPDDLSLADVIQKHLYRPLADERTASDG